MEAPIKSGARNTASHALDQGRDVFAIPANVGTATCAGNMQLLKEGAILVEEGWDVIREYVHLFPQLVSRQQGLIRLSLTREEAAAAAEETDVQTGIVAEKPQKPNGQFDRKIVDKPETKAYIDVHEILDTVSADEKILLRILQDGPTQIDDLIDDSQIAANRVLAALTLLEVKGYAQKLPGGMASLAEEKS